VRVAVPIIEAVVDTRTTGEGSLLILGVDMTGDRSLRDYQLESGDDGVLDDPLVFLAQPDSLILTKEFAGRNGIGVGQPVTLGTVLGNRRFTVRGLIASSGLASAFGGNLAIMDIYAAQRMFGRGRTFDRIDVAVKDGQTVADMQSALREVLGPGFQVDAPAARGQQFEAMTAAYSMMISISSLLALFIGMFIIYNSFAIAVAQRRAEIGILRALGATRRQILWLFLMESAVSGLVGSLVGAFLGLLIARGVAASIGTLIADIYGVAQKADAVLASPSLVGVALLIGVATSIAAAVIPARQAARVDPVHALQKGKFQVLSESESRKRLLAAAALTAVSVTCLVAGSTRLVFYVGYILAITVAVLLGPLLSLILSRALRPILKLIRPVEGALAADSLIQTPRRTSATVAAVMLSLALVVAFAGMARASYDSIIDWVDGTLNPDLFVTPAQDIVVRTLRFPPDMAAELSAIPGVSRVQMVRTSRIVFRGAPVMVVATQMASIADTVRPRAVQGDASAMYRTAAGGRGVLVSDNLAELQGLKLGQMLEVAAPGGVIRLPIVAIVVDYSDQLGTILMDRSVFQQYWNDDSVNIFRLYLERTDEAPAVKRRILEKYAGVRQVFVLTNRDLKSYILRITDQWFSLATVQIAVAVLVAILGIVNTLTVSITDRRRELGVLKAVGGLHGQIRRTIWLEAISIGVLGLALGYALGAVNLYYILQVVHHDIAGLRLDYEFPVTVTLALVPTMLAAAFIAAIWPAESAVRGSLVEALEYE
jgi:putative ABC transport system permease protein